MWIIIIKQLLNVWIIRYLITVARNEVVKTLRSFIYDKFSRFLSSIYYVSAIAAVYWMHVVIKIHFKRPTKREYYVVINATDLD